jgi:hypothetical protein
MPTVLCLLASACGGGFAPADLRTPRTVVPLASLQKTLIYEDPRLGLIRGLVQLPGADGISVFGHTGRCILAMAGDRAICSPALPDAPPPVSIGTFVSDHHIVADFDGDGTPEQLTPLEGAGFKLATAAGTEIARSALERYWVGPKFRYWFEPAVTWSQPRFVLVSVDETILVLDARLHEVRTLPVPGMASPMHVSAGAPLGGGELAPFVSVVVGRGGWHRSVLFIHSASNAVVYQEIVGDDVGAVWPLPEADGRRRFLVGERGRVWRYSFE